MYNFIVKNSYMRYSVLGQMLLAGHLQGGTPLALAWRLSHPPGFSRCSWGGVHDVGEVLLFYKNFEVKNF